MIFVAVEGTQKVTITLFQILFVAAAYEQTNVISRARLLASLLALFSIMFLETFVFKEYDMPHIGCGIHSPQSTIPRIDIRLVTLIGMRVVLYKLNNRVFRL